MDRPLLSVIILSYNTRELLRDCLSSLFRCRPPFETEVIVVDNNSQDGSPDTVKEEFPAVKLIENEENKGFARGINQGFEVSRGRHKLILNSDVVLLDNMVEELVQFFDSYPDAGAVRPMILDARNNLQRQGSGIFRSFKNPDKTHRVDWISGCCMLIRGRAYEQAGIFDENFFFYNEDVDYSRRLKKLGWKLYCFPRARIVHYGGASSVDERKNIVEWYRGKYYLCKKHHGKFALFFYRAFALLELAVKITILSFRPPGKEDIFKKRTETYLKIVRMTLGRID